MNTEVKIIGFTHACVGFFHRKKSSLYLFFSKLGKNVQ